LSPEEDIQAVLPHIVFFKFNSSKPNLVAPFPNGRLPCLDRTTSGLGIVPMSKPHTNADAENNDEKRIKDERILGMTKENSGWDVYNNEAKKVDTELVKDWTTSLNFLLIFVSFILTIYIRSF
jgi:Family of unknown function (DUF6535)